MGAITVRYPAKFYDFLDIHTTQDDLLFQDVPVQPRPQYGVSGATNVQPCHVCKQHGKYNLTLNAYGIGKHFQGTCPQCNGWGWVAAGSKSATCTGHEWKSESIAMCQHKLTCTKCGDVWFTDSSD
jgi:hypothetical protein